MKPIGIGVIGTGWIGEIRARMAAQHPLLNSLHLAELNDARLAFIAEATRAASATRDYHQILKRSEVDAMIVTTTPEESHYPVARDCLAAGKHTLLEKPMGLTLKEADELVALAQRNKLKFTIGYTQRFNPKFAYLKQCVAEGKLGQPVSLMISRNVSRSIGTKIAGRVRLSPAMMEATHDIDLGLWFLAGIRPARVYCHTVYKYMTTVHSGTADCSWMLVTMDDGSALTVGAGWILPPGYPHGSMMNLEFVGSDGAMFIDDTHRDILFNTVEKGTVLPISTMPGEPIGHIYQGPMQAETNHFIEAVAFDRPLLVKPEEARQVLEVSLAADLSAERGEPVTLPLKP
jgi:predicted dehydrogenase